MISNVNYHINMHDAANFKKRYIYVPSFLMVAWTFHGLSCLSVWHVPLDCSCDVCPDCKRDYVDVFVYVCIWFTHQSSCVTSMTCSGGNAVHVSGLSAYCRSSLSIKVRCQGRRKHRKRLEAVWKEAISPPRNDDNCSRGQGRRLVIPEASALLVQWWAVFNKALTTCCKWRVIHKKSLTARGLCFGLGLSNIYQLLKSTLSVIN